MTQDQIDALQNREPRPASPGVNAPAADWRTPDPDDLLVIDTNKGRIVAELAPAAAPKTVAQIKTLARRHFYDGQTFFRVIDKFMDQTGDPQNSGKGSSDLPNVPGEFTFRRGADTPIAVVSRPSGLESGFAGVLPVYSQADGLMGMTADGKVSAWGAFCPGVLGMAREGAPDTGNSQFFLMRDAYPSLEKRYTAFGRVLSGQDVVRAIKVGEPPADPQDRMVRVRLASELPPAERPRIRRLDSFSAAFRDVVDKARIDGGADFSVCDIPVVAQGG